MTRRLLFVHAHPDDESSKGAATAARYADDGAEVVLVTCTGGEAGDVLNPKAEPIPREEMPAARKRELEAAVSVIGFTRTYELGYVDSGYHEDPAEVAEGTFSRVPLDEPSRALALILRRERPHVVVTYPESGGYPHPDHIMNHLVTVRAMELAEDPEADLGERAGPALSPWRVPKVYAASTFPLERLEALHSAMLETHGESPYTEWLESRADRAAPDAPDARVWCPDQFGRRDAALLAHVSQIDPEGFWFGIPRELEAEHYPYEAYVLLRTDVLTQVPEDDLFAGLDVDAIDAVASEDPPASRGA
ncbi:MAG: mycothiol conjugate amidase Mca [Nitriliruptoraceae bacterium]